MTEFTVHVWHHFDSGSVDQKLDQLLTHAGVIMADLKDVQARVTQEGADVAALTATVQKAITLMQGDAATIADLRAQLAAAQAANDPAAIQAVLDNMDAAHAAMTKSVQDLADGVVANS